MIPKNCILHFNGFPGTGKLTIAKEIASQDASFRLIDNHAINNLVFSMVRLDGTTKISEDAWGAIRSIRSTILNFMPEHAHPSLSFIFTNVLGDNDDDKNIYTIVKTAAEKRGSTFVPVVLTCDEEENKRRIVLPEREKNMKMTDAAGLSQLRQLETLLIPDHPNLIQVDVTRISPAEAAGRIKDHALKIMAL